jgi:hypothetical protein
MGGRSTGGWEDGDGERVSVGVGTKEDRESEVSDLVSA